MYVIISIIKISGKPITNLVFLVLCLNVYIPAIPPMPPPSITRINSVFSGILRLFFLAFLLSSHIAANVITLIIIKYITKLLCENIFSIFFGSPIEKAAIVLGRFVLIFI